MGVASRAGWVRFPASLRIDIHGWTRPNGG
jgi:hypothetical protein